MLAVALVAICMTALPAFAWSSSADGGYKLTADDGSLFAGIELVGDLIGDEQSEWDYERSINELAWLASDLDGCRRTTSIYDIYLADMETGERIDLTAPENAALANTQVTLEADAGNELELDIDCAALVRYDEATNTCTKPAYTVRTEKGRIEIGEQTYNNVTIYSFVLTGRLADLMGTYDKLESIADDAPYSDVVSWEPWVEHDFWALSAIEGEHVSFRVVSEEDGDGKNPGTYDKVDGSEQLRFDETLGFKFIAPTDDGYIPDVSYTANGVTTVLEPTDETYEYTDETTWITREYRVYQVPPTAAPVTVTLSAHELTYTVNSNGTITFEQDYYPTANLISFNLPEGVHFLEAQKGTYDYRTAFAVANPQATETGGYDYYCWPDKSSTFTFELPVGYIIESVTLSPASAGTTEFYSNALDVKLDAPATLNIAVTPLQYSHVDIDSVTGISVAMTAEDITGIGLDAATLFVAEEKGASELEKMKDAIIVTLDGGTFSPDELVAYNVWYRYDDGTQFGGLVPYWAFWDGALVTVPLPQGWTAESTRVFQYFYEEWAPEEILSSARELRTVPSEDGTSIVIEVQQQLGRFVLARETPATPVTYDFTKAVVAPIATQTYQGSPVTPAVKVTFDGVTLVQGTDYVVQYINNNAVGTATVYIKGIGSYIGEKEAEFKIIHKPGWGSDANNNWYYYDNNGDPIPNHWEKYAGDYYYFGYDGKLIITGVCYYAGNWYYIKGGKVQFTKSGWQTVNGTWYNFSGPYGAAVKNTWYKSGSSYYFVDKDGMLVVNDWIQYGGKWYHFNAKGVCDRVYP